MNRLFPTLPLLLAALGCDAPQRALPAADPADELVLAAYDVPAGYTAQTQALLSRLLNGWGDTPPTGRVSEGPGGQVVVLAPASVHEGVADLVSRLADVEPQPSRNIELGYWLVEGRRGVTQEALPGDLQAIAPALAEIRAAEGPVHFSLYGQKRLLSLDGERARAEHGEVSITHIASVNPQNDVIVADVEIRTRYGAELDTRVQLAPDQTLVLAEDARFGEDSVAWDTLYYVVRPQIVQP